MNIQLIQALFAEQQQSSYDIEVLCSSRSFAYLQESPRAVIDRVYEYVDAIYERYQTCTMAELLAQYGCEYSIQQSDDSTYKSYKRAMIRVSKKQKTIIVYQESLDELNAIARQFLPQLSATQIEQLHVAHEVFHLLEHELGAEVSDVVQPLLRSNWLIRGKRMEILSEIASYRFSMRFAKLKIHPRAFEYAALLLQNPENEQRVRALFAL